MKKIKAALYYYSATGNTRSACEFIHGRIPETQLFDISGMRDSQTDGFDIIGIAAPVFYLSIPPVLSAFLDSLKSNDGKPVFILLTYGMMTGKTMRKIEEMLYQKGYPVFEYFALRMPESFPPYIARGWTDTDAPNHKEIALFNSFIDTLKNHFNRIASGRNPERKKVRPGFFNSLIPLPTEKSIRKKFGNLVVNETACSSCGKCRDACAYHAISLNEIPSFLMEKCSACYACYNKCPQKAIATSALSNAYHYNPPSDAFSEKLQ